MRTPKKCKALLGEPLQREPPKSVKHFSGNPYGQDLIVNGSSRTPVPTIKWRLYVLYLAPDILMCGTVKTVPYGICYLLTNGPSRTPVPTIKWRLYVLYLAPAVMEALWKQGIILRFYPQKARKCEFTKTLQFAYRAQKSTREDVGQNFR